MTYFGELCRAMKMLADDSRTLFIGQGVGCDGTTMSPTFSDVPARQKIEMPVAENMQMGICTGLSMVGYLPICVFPRWNFLICAADQILNHLDKISLYSDYRPKVIIRVASPSTHPFDPGPQHDADFSNAFLLMLETTALVDLQDADEIVSAYQTALRAPQSTILVEHSDLYREDIAKARGADQQTVREK